MKYTLRQIQVFLATCHQKSISKAATHLSMSQSAASSALKDLETQFGLQLFDRVGKRLHINDSGQALRAKAEALIAMATEIEMDLSQYNTDNTASLDKTYGVLRIGATLTIGNYLAVGLVDQFLKEQSGSRVTLKVANTSEIVEQLENFDLDVGLIEGEYHHPELDVKPWMHDRLQCFCSPKHPLAKTSRLSDSDILSASWILREPGSGTRQTFDRAMSGVLPNIHILLELQHTEAIKRAVGSGLGISCLSEISIREEVQRGDLVKLELPRRSLERQFYMVLHKHKYISRNLQHWITMCQQYQTT